MARFDRSIGRGTPAMHRGTNHRRVCHRTGGCAVSDGPVEPNHDGEKHSFRRLPAFARPMAWLGAVMAVLSMSLLAPALAADPAPPAGPPLAGAPSDATPGAGMGEAAPPLILPDPVQAMAGFTGHLDKDRDFVVAKVEGQTITKGDLADVMRGLPPGMAVLGYQTLFRRGMDQLLRQKMMVLSGRKAGLDKDTVLRRRTEMAAERLLAEAWLTREAAPFVTEDAIGQRYRRDVEGRPGPAEVRARVILLPTDAEAHRVLERLRVGEDFSVLARQFSKDISAQTSGDLGWAPLEALSPEIGAVVFAMAPGQVTAYPVKASTGYYLIRIDGRRQRGAPSLDEARADISSELRREKAADIMRLLISDVKLNAPGENEGPGGPGKPGGR